MGENNVAMANVVLEPFAKVGHNNVFWTGTLICHDVTVGNGNYVAAACVLGGNCRIGDGCFLGNGVIVINDIELARETQVLPGSTLLRSTREFRSYQGNPAREIGNHEERGIAIARG
jgi:UDP-3-O-[3-hydroxymyristoyl] glucosamine N-acyltransferase